MDENFEQMGKEEIKKKMEELATQLADLTHQIVKLDGVGLVQMSIHIINVMGLAQVQTSVQTGMNGAMNSPEEMLEAIGKIAAEIGIPLPADMKEQCERDFAKGAMQPNPSEEVNQVLDLIKKRMN